MENVMLKVEGIEYDRSAIALDQIKEVYVKQKG